MHGSTMLLIYLIMVYSAMVIDTVSSDCVPGSYYQPYQQLCSLCVPGTYKTYVGNAKCDYCKPGTYSSSSGAISCEECEAGKYQPKWGESKCQVCEHGKTTNRIGSTSSTECVCGPGHYNNMSQCYQCDPGTYKASAGDTDCNQCNPGTYSYSYGAISCTECEAGKYQHESGTWWCKVCQYGKTTNRNGSTSISECDCEPGKFYAAGSDICQDCPTGTYQPSIGQSSCLSCKPGSFQNRLGQNDCVPCQAGSYSDTERATTCMPCKTGTYQYSSNQSSCVPCPIGQYQPFEGRLSCYPCESGKTTIGEGSTSPNDCLAVCSAGTFRSNQSQACEICPTGTYQPTPGQTSCLSCVAGTYQNQTSQTSCMQCLPGSYQSSIGSESCIKCSPGFYQPHSGSSSQCLACPVGTYQDLPGAVSCNKCLAGSFQNQTGQMSCIPCPKGSSQSSEGTHEYIACPPENTVRTGADSKEHNTNSGVIAGGAGGAIALVVVVAIVIFIAIRRHRLKETSGHKISRQDNVLPPPNESQLKTSIQQQIREVVYTNLVHEEDSKETCKIVASDEYTSKDNTYYNMEENALLPRGAVMLSNLWDYIQEKTLDGSKLSEEFEALPSGLLSTAKAALKPSNCQKNRYKGLYPYDSTRVRLLPLGEDKSDYINASFIDGYSRPKAYIASQGTTKFNLNDFWRMIYQQDVEKIVMLTRLDEGDTIKCLQYWPKEGSQQQYGGIKVTLVHVDAFAEYDIRTLTMTVENTTKQVTQFHFTAWPDKGVPEAASSIVQFWNKVRNLQSHKRSPTLVHCSAGIGRTGTYIALDYLADQGKDKQYVHIFPCVAQLRRQRVNLVQTEAQYRFLHDALVEALMISGSAVSAETFPSVYKELLAIDRKQRKTGLLLEFEKLQNESNKAVYHSPGDYDTDDEEDESESKMEKITNNPQNTSRLEINKHKNRYRNILPADEYRPCLSLVEGRTDYINAVKLQSHRQKDGLIVTQMPIEDTVIDFWRLVYDFGVRTIVMLNVLPSNTDGIGVYWPCKGESMTEMVFNIENVDENTNNTDYLWRTIRLTKDGEQPREVRQFQCNFWPGSETVPKQMNAMLKLIDAVEQWQRQADIKTVVIHCMDGAERSGLYCVLTTVLERLNVERDVAIYQTVKKMRTRRQQIITNFEQYKYCHDVVLEYLSNFGTYSNFTEI